MQTYDYVMIGVMAAAILFGAWKGLAWQVASLSAIFVSYIVALQFRAPVAAMISVDPPLNGFIAMFAIYAACSLGIWIAFGFVRSYIERFHLRDFDRQAGALLGAIKGALLCIVVTIFAVTLLGQEPPTDLSVVVRIVYRPHNQRIPGNRSQGNTPRSRTVLEEV